MCFLATCFYLQVGSHKIRYVRFGGDFWGFDIISLNMRSRSGLAGGVAGLPLSWRNSTGVGLRWRRGLPYN